MGRVMYMKTETIISGKAIYRIEDLYGNGTSFSLYKSIRKNCAHLRWEFIRSSYNRASLIEHIEKKDGKIHKIL